MRFIFLHFGLAFLVGTPAMCFTLTQEERLTAFDTYRWPTTTVIRHLVFEAPGGLRFDVYKNEMSFSEQPDLIEMLSNQGLLNANASTRQSIQTRLGAQNAQWYQDSIARWINHVEVAEQGRKWPAIVVSNIRNYVIKNADAVDYIVASRLLPTGGHQEIGTLRRMASAEYYVEGAMTPVVKRRKLVVEHVLNVELEIPRIEVRRRNGPPISGGELNEIGGLWIRDGENKEQISSYLLALLTFLIDDPRIPEPFRSDGRRWIEFSDAPGQRFFQAKYGFTPRSDLPFPVKHHDFNFYVGENTFSRLRDKLIGLFDCGRLLLDAATHAHRITQPF